MAKSSRVRFFLAGILGASALAASATPAANADLLPGLLGGSCPGNGTQMFAAWDDYSSYYLAPNGGFEYGSLGWSLSGGASVASGNEPFYADGTHSLALPSGSTATSMYLCIGPKNVALRMFGSDAGGTDSGLHVRVIWYGLLNRVLGASDYDTFAPGGDWAPTSNVDSQGGFNLLLPLLGSTSARIQLRPLGSGSNWRIDDVAVDPWVSKCC